MLVVDIKMSDNGAILHALGGLLLGILILLMYYFGASDVWPITLCFSLAFPLRDLYQHDWKFKKLLEPHVALEAFPAFIIVWGFDIAGRIVWGAA